MFASLKGKANLPNRSRLTLAYPLVLHKFSFVCSNNSPPEGVFDNLKEVPNLQSNVFILTPRAKMESGSMSFGPYP